MVKVMIPVTDESGKEISQHFGRAPYWAWYLVEGGKISENGAIPNDSDHFGGVGSPPEKIAAHGGNIVISAGMGTKAISLFQEAKVAVLKAQSLDTLENVHKYIAGSLIEETEGCLHEH